MNGPQMLEEHVGELITSMGAFFPGERVVFRGKDLFTSLKDLDWLEQREAPVRSAYPQRWLYQRQRFMVGPRNCVAANF